MLVIHVTIPKGPDWQHSQGRMDAAAKEQLGALLHSESIDEWPGVDS